MDGDNDLLPPTPTPPTPAIGDRARKNITCQFCECSLTGAGDVLKMSTRAKSLRDFEDDLEDTRKDLAQARIDIDRLTSELGSVQAKLAAELKKNKW